MILNKLLNQKDQNYLFVFFVVNPISTVVTRLIIEKLDLHSKNILIVSFRNTDLSLLNFRSLFVEKNKLDRVFEKITLSSISGKRILSKINNQNFILFASWSFKEVNYLLKSSNCIGHYYIEEGQAAHRVHNPYSFNLVSFKQTLINNFKNRINDGNKDDLAFRDDCFGFIGLTDKSFLQISADRKIILDNIDYLKTIYEAKLIGIKHIGLTYAERRLGNISWKEMINNLIRLLPPNSVIKAHPSLMLSQRKIKLLSKYIQQNSQGKIKLCSNDIILEIEMLFEKKVILGPMSSLYTYANFFQSEFKKIDYID